MKNYGFAIFWLLLFCFLVNSLNFVSNALGSHMVLQRGPQKAHIWGWSTPGSTVHVKLNEIVYDTVTAMDNSWNVYLAPMPAGGPHTIEITSSVGEVAILTDILFGDVYICSGQSNMQFTVDSAVNASEEVKAAVKYPNIRVFTIGTKTKSTTPLEELAAIEQPWVMASPSSIGVGNWSAFSAVCWFFGRDLYDQLKVPIGLFSDNWAGTVIQTWTSTKGLSMCKQPQNSTVDESLLWNSMIVPILPMTITGAIWYQGESNADYADYYACAFPVMIKDWRTNWGGDTDSQFPFLFVQLAPWIKSGTGDGNAAEASIRLSQMCATRLPNTGYATAADLGEPLSPFGSGHPRFKQQVGYRLSLAARGIIYNEKLQYKGPEAISFTVLSDGPSASVQIDFVDDSIGSGLKYQPKTCDPNISSSLCSEFEIGGEDGSWKPSKVTLDTNIVVVSSTLPDKMKVTGVRYGWSSYPLMTLYNQEGLPAIPFVLPNPIKCT